ncbi:MAG: DEAD/DEAH box helicase [Candidatus Eisenbacteria bacterium]|uniref:DEAD/DEAH box helicase n=1 Tax=Eiseniibacteriota bacterium TaxID=2212470 RepID=A0A849SSM3_UNCEI|nr:DEAD/DEAH box helicase [Candidatus Eisenbacteria bacterium]
MDVTTPRYLIGQRLRHPQFGEGLVVEVHTDRGREVLEVVFDGQLRRLSAARAWDILDVNGSLAASESTATAPDDWDNEAAEDSGEPGPPTLADSRGPGTHRIWHPQGDRLLERWRAGRVVSSAHFDLRLAAEHWAGWAVPDRLISLDSLRGVERFPHQIKACLKAMRELNGRAILADEVGLGKTIEAGIILKEYLLRGAVRTALVLVPASLCEQWCAELWEKFELDFVVSRGPSGQWGRHPLVISSLETARHERHRRRVRGANYDLVIVDEAHRLRNHQTLGWKFINDLNPRYLLLLTATPVQNDMRELFNLATLVRPGTVGTFSQFRRDFLSGHDRRAPRNTPKLRTLLQNVMIRTRRVDTDIAFPPRKVETLAVTQNAEESKLYRQVSDFIAESVRADAHGPGRAHYFTLVVLQKEMGSSWSAAAATLEKLARNPDGLDSKRLRALAARAAAVQQQQTKVRSLIRRIQSLQPKKCIVFTQFRSTQDTIVEALQQIGIEPAVFHGELGWREKEEALERFRTTLPVLVSTEAGGEGRNLQFCQIVINYDLPWNPMRVEQRIGRVHRLGQQHPVRVINMVARGTIEAYVLEILDRKIKMFELVVGEIEEILGTWQMQGSFEDEIFKRWTESVDPRVRKKRFAELAQNLQYAQREYLEYKERQDLLFPSSGKENNG